jgi:hypothetical protein
VSSASDDIIEAIVDVVVGPLVGAVAGLWERIRRRRR